MSAPASARPRGIFMRRKSTMIQKITAAEPKRIVAPQNGGNSKLLNRTATALLPPRRTTAKNATKVIPSILLITPSAISSLIGFMESIPLVQYLAYYVAYC